MPIVAVPIAGLVALALLLFALAFRPQIEALGNALAQHLPTAFRGIANAFTSAALTGVDLVLRALSPVAVWAIRLFGIPAEVALGLLDAIVRALSAAHTVTHYLSRIAIPASESRAKGYALQQVRVEAGARVAAVDGARLYALELLHGEASTRQAADVALHNEISTTATRTLDEAHADAHAQVADAEHALTGELSADMSNEWARVKDLVGVTGAGLAALIASNTTALAHVADWIDHCGEPACNLTNELSPLLNQLKNLSLDAIILTIVHELLSNPEAGAHLVAGLAASGFGTFEHMFGGLLAS